MLKILLTPTFWGTIAGIILVVLGHPTPAGICLTIVGWGTGIALELGVRQDKDPWRMDTVLEVIGRVLVGQLPRSRWGLLGHLPQAVAGMVLLAL